MALDSVSFIPSWETNNDPKCLEFQVHHLYKWHSSLCDKACISAIILGVSDHQNIHKKENKVLKLLWDFSIVSWNASYFIINAFSSSISLPLLHGIALSDKLTYSKVHSWEHVCRWPAWFGSKTCSVVHSACDLHGFLALLNIWINLTRWPMEGLKALNPMVGIF